MLKIIRKINENKTIIWLSLVVGIAGRLLPHPPNITPLTSLSLFVSMALPPYLALSVVIITLFVSDIGLGILLSYPIIGPWTLFTYSGFVFIVLFGSKIKASKNMLPIYILGSSFGFWFWTNFGVWLTSNLYPNTISGLWICYTAALPFLHNSILGDLFWGIIIFGSCMLTIKQPLNKLLANSKT